MSRILTLVTVSAIALGAPLAASAASKDCPPGLANKSHACEAPGQAKKHDGKRDDRKDSRRHEARHERGDRVPDGYVLVREPTHYGLPRGTYYHRGADVVRVDPDTRKILAVVGLIDALSD